MAEPVDYSVYGPLYAGWARLLSLLLALVLSGLLLFIPSPPHLGSFAASAVDYGLLVLCFWGVAAGFIHGVGYVPLMNIWRYIFSPYAGWPVMLICIIWWLS